MDKNNPIKHVKYKKCYKNDTLYWGLGIENEMYLEFEKTKQVNKMYLCTNRKRERYSVDYFSNYKNDTALKQYVETISDVIQIPILLNSHSFMNTDKMNNSKRMYTKLNEPNPKFCGETLIESLIKDNDYFRTNLTWLFDGDTIEFTTLDFFNVTLEDVLKELENIKVEFIENINTSFTKLGIFKEYGSIKIMETNYPFATYLTNLNNVGMFNNGTLHYNITLPTKLDSNGFIENKELFVYTHSKAIKMIQWIEPLLIGIFGSPDPLPGYSKSSQRCAVSRYIGIGTYDNTTMVPGKILTKPINELPYNGSDWWYNKINMYTRLDELGMDINFNKHYNHGIELRFLDYTSNIAESFMFIIFCMDYSLKASEIENPIINKTWNDFVANMLIHGKKYILTKDEKRMYKKLFSITIKKETLEDVYHEIYSKIKKIGPFSKLTLSQKKNKWLKYLQCYS